MMKESFQQYKKMQIACFKLAWWGWDFGPHQGWGKMFDVFCLLHFSTAYFVNAT